MQVNDEQLFRIDLTKLWKRSLDTKEIRGIYCNIYFSIPSNSTNNNNSHVTN